MTLGRASTLAGGLLCLAVIVSGSAAAGSADKMIEGTITVVPDQARHVEPRDRLIIKLFHPEGGVEMDKKFQIIPKFALPFDFRISPALDMSRRTKWHDYVVEVFIDKDGNTRANRPDELVARSTDLVPLGTTGLTLELNAIPR